MRKIIFSVSLVISIALVFAVPCHAKEMKDNAGTKLARGIINIMMAPVEFVKGMTTEPYDKGAAYDLPVGIGKGFSNMSKRFGAGVYDVVTFPIPVPKGYAPVLKEDKNEEIKEEAKKEVPEEKK
jgi:putative exosortase-associated protein (TIGR04073 family)